MPDLYPAEWGAARAHVDRVLMFDYTQQRSKGWSRSEWCVDNKALVAFVLLFEAVERLLKVQGTWQGHEQGIDAVTCWSNSFLGDKLFGFARQATRFDNIGSLIDEQIAATWASLLTRSRRQRRWVSRIGLPRC